MLKNRDQDILGDYLPSAGVVMFAGTWAQLAEEWKDTTTPVASDVVGYQSYRPIEGAVAHTGRPRHVLTRIHEFAHYRSVTGSPLGLGLAHLEEQTMLLARGLVNARAASAPDVTIALPLASDTLPLTFADTDVSPAEVFRQARACVRAIEVLIDQVIRDGHEAALALQAAIDVLMTYTGAECVPEVVAAGPHLWLDIPRWGLTGRAVLESYAVLLEMTAEAAISKRLDLDEIARRFPRSKSIAIRYILNRLWDPVDPYLELNELDGGFLLQMLDLALLCPLDVKLLDTTPVILEEIHPVGRLVVLTNAFRKLLLTPRDLAESAGVDSLLSELGWATMDEMKRRLAASDSDPPDLADYIFPDWSGAVDEPKRSSSTWSHLRTEAQRGLDYRIQNQHSFAASRSALVLQPSVEVYEDVWRQHRQPWAAPGIPWKLLVQAFAAVAGRYAITGQPAALELARRLHPVVLSAIDVELGQTAIGRTVLQPPYVSFEGLFGLALGVIDPGRPPLAV
jgi:hypothetical protein